MASAVRRMNQAAGVAAVGGVLGIIQVFRTATVMSRAGHPAINLAFVAGVGALSVLLTLTLAYLIYRKRSRAAALVNLALYVPWAVFLIMAGHLVGILIVAIFLPIYIRGVMGALSYHALRKQEKVPITPAPVRTHPNQTSSPD
jgi:hypothetical protein